MPDQKAKNAGGIVDIDQFIEIVINQYAHMANKVKAIVEDVFISADVSLLKIIDIVRHEWLAINGGVRNPDANHGAYTIRRFHNIQTLR